MGGIYIVNITKTNYKTYAEFLITKKNKEQYVSDICNYESRGEINSIHYDDCLASQARSFNDVDLCQKITDLPTKTNCIKKVK